MIPDGILPKHIEKAIVEIEKNGIPHHRESVHYDFVYKGKIYPPKYLISIASKYAFREELSAYDFSTFEARKYLQYRKYTVIDRRNSEKNIIEAIDDESSFPEGKERYQDHIRRERDSGIVKKAKALRLKKEGRLSCEVCNFDFSEVYGPLGIGFIEAHHIVPVSELDGRSNTKVSELSLVCSNCHRMLHHHKPLLKVEELRDLFF